MADGARPLRAAPSTALSGIVRAPGDKSISHRALLLSALSVGRARLSGLLEGADVLDMAKAITALGAAAAPDVSGDWPEVSRDWIVDGVGVGGFAEPETCLDLGNSGTAARLLMGAIAGHPLRAFMTGDRSLRARPMARVADPLRRLGARIETRSGGRLPLMIDGAAAPLPIAYRLPVPSAQVKSAILLAGLAAPGRTTVVEPAPTRDHTERLLRLLGAEIAVEDRDDGRHVTLIGQPELAARDIDVPGDPSSAAFPLVAALIVPGSEITVSGIAVNPLRTGLFDCLSEMGADIEIRRRDDRAGEPVADMTARAGALRAIEVPAARAPRMIDEYPILAVAAAHARGTTVMHGLGELRVKESNRLDAIARGLAANGVEVSIDGDSLSVTGGPVAGGGRVETHHDHRIAMSFLMLGLAARAPITIDDGRMIATSYPAFVETMTGLGAELGAVLAADIEK